MRGIAGRSNAKATGVHIVRNVAKTMTPITAILFFVFIFVSIGLTPLARSPYNCCKLSYLEGCSSEQLEL
jgi:preprotein translocase subunit SecG